MRFLLAAFCLTLIAGCQNEPAPSAPSFQLDNGLRVTLMPTKADSDRTCLLVLYDTGHRSDPPGQSGLAHLIEHIYVTAATDQVPSRTVEEFLAAYPLGWNAQVGDDYTVLATVFEPAALVEEIRDAAERMRHLQITAADLKRERPRIETELNSMYWGPLSLAFLNHGRDRTAPLPNAGQRGGKMAEINRLTLADIQQRLDQYYKPANAHVVLAGDMEVDQAEQQIRAAFGAINAGKRRPAPPPLAAPIAGRHPIDYLKGLSVGLSYRAPEPDHELYPAFLLLAMHLQAAQFDNDRPEFRCSYMALDDPRSFHVRTDIRKGEADSAAAKRLRDALNATLNKLLSAEQLVQAKRMLSTFVSPERALTANRGRNPYSPAFALARLDQMGWEGNDLSERLEEVDAAQIKQVVETFFVANNEVAVQGTRSKDGPD